MLIFYIICGGLFTYVIVNIILDNSSKEEKIETTLVDKKTDSFIDANNMIYEEYFLIFLIGTQEKRFSVSYKTLILMIKEYLLINEISLFLL